MVFGPWAQQELEHVVGVVTVTTDYFGAANLRLGRAASLTTLG
jgi:hypothetical protein